MAAGVGAGVGVGLEDAAARNAIICMIHEPLWFKGAVAVYDPTLVTYWSSRISASGTVRILWV